MVTDAVGTLHKTPLGNKPTYQSRNRILGDKAYKIQEMEETEIDDFMEKHDGIDPEFVTPSKANEMIASKDDTIKQLQAQLAALQNGVSAKVQEIKESQQLKGSVK